MSKVLDFTEYHKKSLKLNPLKTVKAVRASKMGEILQGLEQVVLKHKLSRVKDTVTGENIMVKFEDEEADISVVLFVSSSGKGKKSK